MKIKDLGEFNFIEQITSQFSKNLPSNVEGIGDDCAIIYQENSKAKLVTTDLLIENIHFLKNDITPFDLGHKSLAVNLSDIAAMGGTPLYAFLSLALPPELETNWLKLYFDGFHQLSSEYNVHLLGGDTTKSSQDIIINIALIGEACPQKIKRRSQAKIGDYICVTNFLGDSGAGLDIILNKRKRSPLENELVNCHYRPHAHIKEGQWLAEKNEIHAMMDVSDGISSDLKRMMEQSKCGIEIDLENLPISEKLKTYCLKHSLEINQFALHSGEDYCLLFTIDSNHYERISQNYLSQFKCPIYKIGRINSTNNFTYFLNGENVQIIYQGFDHFKQGNNND